MPKNPQNFRKYPNFFPKKSLKNPKNLLACYARRRGPALPDRGGFANFFDDRGVLADPLLTMPGYNNHHCNKSNFENYNIYYLYFR